MPIDYAKATTAPITEPARVSANITEKLAKANLDLTKHTLDPLGIGDKLFGGSSVDTTLRKLENQPSVEHTIRKSLMPAKLETELQHPQKFAKMLSWTIEAGYDKRLRAGNPVAAMGYSMKKVGDLKGDLADFYKNANDLISSGDPDAKTKIADNMAYLRLKAGNPKIAEQFAEDHTGALDALKEKHPKAANRIAKLVEKNVQLSDAAPSDPGTSPNDPNAPIKIPITPPPISDPGLSPATYSDILTQVVAMGANKGTLETAMALPNQLKAVGDPMAQDYAKDAMSYSILKEKYPQVASQLWSGNGYTGAFQILQSKIPDSAAQIAVLANTVYPLPSGMRYSNPSDPLPTGVLGIPKETTVITDGNSSINIPVSRPYLVPVTKDPMLRAI